MLTTQKYPHSLISTDRILNADLFSCRQPFRMEKSILVQQGKSMCVMNLYSSFRNSSLNSQDNVNLKISKGI